MLSFLCMAYLLPGLLIVHTGFKFFKSQMQMVKIPCVILENKITEYEKNKHELRIKYQYNFQGKSFTGTLAKRDYFLANLKAIQAHYDDPQKNFNCYIKSGAPEISVFSYGYKWLNIALIAIGAVTVTFALYLLWWICLKCDKYKEIAFMKVNPVITFGLVSFAVFGIGVHYFFFWESILGFWENIEYRYIAVSELAAKGNSQDYSFAVKLNKLKDSLKHSNDITFPFFFLEGILRYFASITFMLPISAALFLTFRNERRKLQQASFIDLGQRHNNSSLACYKCKDGMVEIPPDFSPLLKFIICSIFSLPPAFVLISHLYKKLDVAMDFSNLFFFDYIFSVIGFGILIIPLKMLSDCFKPRPEIFLKSLTCKQGEDLNIYWKNKRNKNIDELRIDLVEIQVNGGVRYTKEPVEVIHVTNFCDIADGHCSYKIPKNMRVSFQDEVRVNENCKSQRWKLTVTLLLKFKLKVKYQYDIVIIAGDFSSSGEVNKEFDWEPPPELPIHF